MAEMGAGKLMLLGTRALIFGRTAGGKLKISLLACRTNKPAVISRVSGDGISLAWIHILITLTCTFIIVLKNHL